MIYTIGETVIDMIFKDMQPCAAKVGGSALNTSVSLGRLGDKVSFISEIGNDELGTWCKRFLNDNHINTSHLVQYADKKTSLALAFLDKDSNATYRFYKEFTDAMPSAALQIHQEDIVLFSSSFAINTRVRPSVTALLTQATEVGCLVMYDPNMRKQLDTKSDAYTYMNENLRFADVVHISNEDAQAIFGTADAGTVFETLQKYQVSAMVFTQNKHDVIIQTPTFRKAYPVPPIPVVSTIGAGDTFNAGILHSLSAHALGKKDIATVGAAFWDEAVPFAIRCSGEVCQSMENYIS